MQGALLARVLLSPDRQWTLSELARDLEAPLTSVQSEVNRLVGGGILATGKVGRARLVRANSDNPAVAPLAQFTLMTFGPQTVIRDAFAALGAERVIVFGSWAARYHGERGPRPSDIDVLVVGDNLDRAAIYRAAEDAEARLHMPVNPVLRHVDAWEHAEGDPLIAEIRHRPHVDVTTRSS